MGTASENLPLVSIVMATYNPRLDWFREQLRSLNDQTYINIELIVCDDCSDKISMSEIEKYISEEITNFKYEIIQNEANIGSNKTFERLTQLAHGEYIAYCDQDDVWCKNKIQIYVDEIREQNAVLICSNMYIIDGEGKRIADSMTKVRKHHIFRSGSGLAPQLLFSNFVTGCAMMIISHVAKGAIPFCPYMVHDHYLALYCANMGSIGYVSKPLIYYRIHGTNQTTMMAGVNDKRSYLDVRINLALDKMNWLDKNFICDNELKTTIHQGIEWLEARKHNMEGHREQRVIIWKYRNFSKLTSLFELLATDLPDRLFMVCIEIKRKNLI